MAKRKNSAWLLLVNEALPLSSRSGLLTSHLGAGIAGLGMLSLRLTMLVTVSDIWTGLAIGLHQKDVSFTIYEEAPQYSAVGSVGLVGLVSMCYYLVLILNFYK